MAFEVPDLPYPYDALEPHIDEATMKLHHDKHHQAYVDKANDALSGTDWEGKPVEEVLKNLDQLPDDKRTAVRNNAGGHANHSFFWEIMSPDGGGDPSGELASRIGESFGGLDELKEQVNAAGVGQFGSGWTWLVHDGSGLAVTSTPNQDSPISSGQTPLIGIDVWEHAYYLKYQNKRPDYLQAWWNVINWDEVPKRFEAAGGCPPPRHHERGYLARREQQPLRSDDRAARRRRSSQAVRRARHLDRSAARGRPASRRGRAAGADRARPPRPRVHGLDRPPAADHGGRPREGGGAAARDRARQRDDPARAACHPARRAAGGRRRLDRCARAPREVDLEPDARGGVAHHAPAIGESLHEVEAPAAGLALAGAAAARLEARSAVAHFHVDLARVQRDVEAHQRGRWHVGVPHAVRDELRDEQPDVGHQIVVHLGLDRDQRVACDGSSRRSCLQLDAHVVLREAAATSPCGR